MRLRLLSATLLGAVGIVGMGALVAGCTTSVTPTSRPDGAVRVSSSSPTRATSAATSASGQPTPTPTPGQPTPSPAARRTTTSAESGLPLQFTTANATQIVTVVAPDDASTTATVQAWQRQGSRWERVGPGVTAWIGADGMSRHPSESRSATPVGSFTLTQAFGHDANPGTSLPYLHTNPSDWWISQPGPLYNTHQRCSSGCGFAQGDPNEHLYYETPYYDYAVVIDYNTRNAPGGVRQGAGSAFFLHVTVEAPTQGCVSIAKSELVRILRWLRPSGHPRILIGIS